MKPGTKSRKLGLEIPTVNPCNDFIVDYLIRNKIKSDKQVLCKSYLYNLAIEAVRKYPLPLICEEQLAALEGFGNFFIGQVGRLIKKHYNRGRLPTEKQMEEDDEAHFQALRAKKKPDENPLGKVYSNLERDLDSPGFGSSRTSQVKRKYYRPKKNTEPFHILQALVKLNANKHAVTKGDINQILFEEGKQKIRLWYVLRQKLQEFDFINLDPKNEEYFYLTEKGLNYVVNYDKQQQTRSKGKKRSKKSDDSESDSQEQPKQKAKSTVSQKQTQQQDSEQDEDKQKKTKATSTKQSQSNKPSKIMTQMKIRKNNFAKNAKFQSVQLLINERSSDLQEKQKIMEKISDLNYQFCEINLADFLWSTQGKILDYMAIRIKQDQFDEQVFKTACFRAKMTSCDNIFIIMQKKLKGQQKSQTVESLPTQEESPGTLICSAIISGIKIFRTRDLQQTMKLAQNLTKLIFEKISRQEVAQKVKKGGKTRSNSETNEQESLKYLGNLETFNKKVGCPYEMATIMNEILKCIPDLSQKSIKVLLEKYPTLAIMHKKTQDAGSTKDKKNLLSYFLNEKVSDSSLNTLVQLLFYETY